MQKIDNAIRRLIGWLATAQAYAYRAQAVPVWTCADGRVMPITEMSDNHLTNAIKLIERGAPHGASRAPILPMLYAEHARRGLASFHDTRRTAREPLPAFADWKHTTPAFSPGNPAAKPRESTWLSRHEDDERAQDERIAVLEGNVRTLQRQYVSRGMLINALVQARRDYKLRDWRHAFLTKLVEILAVKP